MESALRAGLLQEDFQLNAVQLDADYGRVDESYATFEWSAGGMVHVHIVLWISGSPRIDKVITPSSTAQTVAELHLDVEDRVELEQARHQGPVAKSRQGGENEAAVLSTCSC